jgi:hypothetical protein
MKDFQPVAFDPQTARQELLGLRALLDRQVDLEENRDIKPLVEASPNLSAMLGAYVWGVSWFDRVGYQYQLFGDFSCDVVVGDSHRKSFVFVELEDATAGSIFTAQGKKATLEWSRRYERGVGQIMDWFWKLDDMASTEEFEARFGQRRIACAGLLVIGRDAHLDHPRDRKRWEWRRQKVVVNSLPLVHETYDGLCATLLSWVDRMYPPPAAPG